MVLEAYSLLKRIKNGVTPEAKISFSHFQEFIKKVAHDLPLDNPPTLPGIKTKAKTKLEEYLNSFCLENRLYLNVCNFCQRCDAAVGDTIVIREMHVPQTDKSYLTLSSYLNQIKQDYITARALLVLSRYPKLNLDLFDKQVVLIDTLEDTVNNIYVQLVKTSFITFYNILDKLAFFINDYLKLSVNEDYINFSNVWFEDPTMKTTIRPAILITENPSLNAVYDIYKDLDKGAYKQLKKTRNALTHRFVKLKINPELQTDTIMSEENLVDQTILLARVVRNGIIYLLQFVRTEERKNRPKNTKNKQIIAHAIPDKSKNRKSKRKRIPSDRSN